MNYLQEFNERHLTLFKDMKLLKEQLKELEKQDDILKKTLLENMKEYGIKTIDNDFIKVSVVAGSESITIDLKELEKQEPETYEDILKDYPKVVKRKESVRITVK